ncbi:IS1595 family transposase [Dysgonomonas sp. 216]|uniref:IS1595 family transposase n=1 Tax=Dysgonomonas sp. 216 TaxID=2302934 RepID=UPI0013D34CCB|nr:IS1595 family transposase [Dysgonomonas sp. 216]NDW19019.1 IS1595 family transposase [Dysgonomonas sp. 216]
MLIKSLIHMIEKLQSEEDCRLFLEDVRWQGKPICPHCGSINEKHYRLTTNGVFKGLYKCKDCRERFTVTVGTIFESSHIGLKKWFLAIYIFVSHKKGISSVQLSKDINVTQKTAWFMLSRIRHNFYNKIKVKFDNRTQADETYVGGKKRKGDKRKKTQGRSTLIKVPVMGLLSDGKVYTEIIPKASGWVLKTIINRLVKQGSVIVTDGWKGYSGLSKDFIHKVVDHSHGQYVKDGFHTNSIEGFWSQLKRGILGIYHLVSPKHLHAYCDEFAYRYNTRDMSDGERFELFLSGCTDRLKYKELIWNWI